MSNDQPLQVPGKAPVGIDLYAVALSLLCILHCLALPLLAAVLPLAGMLSENELVHRGLVLASAPATLWVAWLIKGTRGAASFCLVAVCGQALLFLGAFASSLERVRGTAYCRWSSSCFLGASSKTDQATS